MADPRLANREFRRIEERLSGIDVSIAVQAQAIMTLTETIRTFIARNRADDCPFRVEIALSSKGTERVESLDEKVQDMDKNLAIAAARGGFIGSGSTGVLILVGYGFAKAMGWA